MEPRSKNRPNPNSVMMRRTPMHQSLLVVAHKRMAHHARWFFGGCSSLQCIRFLLPKVVTMDMYETVLGWQSLISVRSAGMYTVVFVPRSRISRDGWTQADALAEVERLSSNPLCQHLSHVTWKQIHWTRYLDHIVQDVEHQVVQAP